MNNVTSIVQHQPQSPWLNEAQQQLVRDSFLNGAERDEAAVLMEVSRALGLNPLLKQIWFVKRWDSRKGRDVWAFQVGIDGFRLIAERTGEYDGQDEPEFVEDAQGNPSLCKVRVYRKGISRPFVGFAYWREYVQTDRNGKVTAMWERGKHFMLAKCAEACGLRKAFPQSLSGVYTPEELGSEEREVNASPPKKTQLVVVQDEGPDPRGDRRSALWVKARASGMSAEDFKAWTQRIVGREVPSSDWTEDDISSLEASLEAEIQPQEQVTEEFPQLPADGPDLMASYIVSKPVQRTLDLDGARPASPLPDRGPVVREDDAAFNHLMTLIMDARKDEEFESAAEAQEQAVASKQIGDSQVLILNRLMQRYRKQRLPAADRQLEATL